VFKVSVVRESYRTREEALRAVERYRRMGIWAALVESYPSIGKYVVERATIRTLVPESVRAEERAAERTQAYKEVIERLGKQILDEDEAVREYNEIIAKLEPFTSPKTPFYYKISRMVTELRGIAQQEREHRDKLIKMQEELNALI